MSTVLTNNYLFSANIDETEEQIKTAIYQEFIRSAESYSDLKTLFDLIKGLEIIEEQKIEFTFKDTVFTFVVNRVPNDI